MSQIEKDVKGENTKTISILKRESLLKYGVDFSRASKTYFIIDEAGGIMFAMRGINPANTPAHYYLFRAQREGDFVLFYPENQADKVVNAEGLTREKLEEIKRPVSPIISEFIKKNLLRDTIRNHKKKEVEAISAAVEEQRKSSVPEKTYVQPGEYDEFYAFLSGGSTGQLSVYGLPSGRLLREIPVFSKDAHRGYGFNEETKNLLNTSFGFIPWGDAHQPSVSMAHGIPDNRWIFLNETNTPRIARIDQLEKSGSLYQSGESGKNEDALCA